MRPDARGRVNETVVGVLGRAQRLTSMSVIDVSVMSNHLHALVFAEDARQLASFMGHVDTNLSKEIGRLHGWPGTLWDRRYRAILVSDEEEAQVARLKYLLAAGVKEQLVERAIDWPGVHGARALTRDHELRGWWFDRTREFAARRRGERPGRYEYATEETLVLDPLPCWRHLPIAEYRRRVKELIREIEREARVERRAKGRECLGAEAVMETEPHPRPERLDRSPAPQFHAWRRQVRKEMWEAYAWVVAAYREAAERLRISDREAPFPEGTFPPGLPFVPFARGQPP